MIKIISLITDKKDISKDTVTMSLTLPFEMRQKSRFKTTLDNGREAGVILDRGYLLRGGDYCQTEGGDIVEIKAANESVSTVYCDDSLALARASYHLGNRHVSLQISEKWIRYLHDHVLDEMVEGLGLNVTVEMQAFEPEAGAYGGGHSHAGDDVHKHPASHEHNHSHSHQEH